jgi:hypothetical protein
VGDEKNITKIAAEEYEGMTPLERPRHRRNIRVEGENESTGSVTGSCGHGYEHQGFTCADNIATELATNRFPIKSLIHSIRYSEVSI